MEDQFNPAAATAEAEPVSQTPAARSPDETKRLRELVGRRVRSINKFIKKKYKDEMSLYIKMYRNEFSKFLPERLMKMDDIDVNVVYPIVKTLIPSLYFQDPKVIVKPLDEKITVPSGATDPLTGQEMVDEYDGPRSALIFQNTLNMNIREANLKSEVKLALQDAHLGFFGAIKSGWGNEQGVEPMGEGAPPSVRDGVFDDMAYGIRVKPWEVLPDMSDFYNPAWIAIRYTVRVDQLKKDARLRNTDKLQGNTEMEERDKQDYWAYLEKEDTRLVEYFEYYHKPCAEFPNGFFCLLTEEVKDDFLWDGDWPYVAKDFPIKLFYFNADPEGGLPIPDVRYYAQQQKAKSNLRRVAYEYIQRTLPGLAIDHNSVANKEQVEKDIASGQIPRVVKTNKNPNAVVSQWSFPNLNADFHTFDALIDDDTSRVTGLIKGVHTGGQDDIQLASVAKIADQGEQVRNSERSDIVKDFLKSIVKFWAKLYQQFGGEENYTPIEGEKFPIKWSVREIQGGFHFDIKPFSMSYEDPVVRRRQWVDLLNLLANPALVQLVAQQGAQIDFLKIINRVLETYDERDVESFVIDDNMKPENQVANALMENQSMTAAGRIPPVQPTDNDKLHIMIHGLLGEVGLEHILMHQQKMLQGAPSQGPGGGNAEGLPLNGGAANQEMFSQPLQPSPQNQEIARNREAKKPTKTR